MRMDCTQKQNKRRRKNGEKRGSKLQFRQRYLRQASSEIYFFLVCFSRREFSIICIVLSVMGLITEFRPFLHQNVDGRTLLLLHPGYGGQRVC